MRTCGDARHEEVGESAEDDERILALKQLRFAGVALGKAGCSNGSSDASQLANIAAGELHTADVGVLCDLRDDIGFKVQAASCTGVFPQIGRSARDAGMSGVSETYSCRP